ncbi:MAG: response regulator [Candidatus Obscuribacterales bacterium]|nr:response regulator [Candidatus Obscuribacterales bacterium]
MTDEPKVEEATGADKLSAKNTFRILIMDTPQHVAQLKAACNDAGHSVVSAHTIKEAFLFLDGKNHADVIVCAAHLEDESMFEFLKRLRADPIHKKSMFMILALEPGPKAIQLSDSTKRAALLLGADAFVSMPAFDASQLIAEIKKVLPLVPLLEAARLEGEKKGT